MEAQLADLQITTIPAGEQYILYGFKFFKLMARLNTMQTFYFATKKMAQEAYVTVQYFIYNWDRGYHGGELGSAIRKWDPYCIGVVTPNAISASIFTKINDEELMNQQGHIIKMSTLVQRSNELNKHICVVTHNPTGIPKGYDEHMLAVLRLIGLPPRIKRPTFTLNPFKYDYVETDENTVRKMGLVI
jgi:hypothetical protein